MTESDGYSPRRQLLEVLLRKIDQDTYPSTTMMDMAEALLEPEDVPGYAETLLAKVEDDRFPSIPLMRRLALIPC